MNKDYSDGGCLTQDPRNSNVVYAGATYYNNSSGRYSMAVIKSTNTGISWPQSSFPGIGAYGTSCEAIAVAPSNPSIVYAGGQNDYQPKVFRSTNGGGTWEDITSNLNTILPRYDIVNAIWVSPYDPTAVLIGTSGGVFRWAPYGRGRDNIWNPTTITYSTQDFAYDSPRGCVFAATYCGVFQTDDEGLTWQEVNDGLGHLDSLCLDIDVLGRLLYVGTNGGSVWRLILPDASGYEYSAVVDDFEGYTDDDQAGQAIWQTWIDGFDSPENGSQIGHPLPPYAEKTIVHGGAQSMPYYYDNSPGYSEATMTLDSQRDWTMYGVKSLSLWFYGGESNAAERMYVAVANSRRTPGVIYNDDPNAAKTNTWTQWSIDLQKFADQGVDLTNVDKLSIGFGDKHNRQAGGSGLVFFDDIRLYRPPSQ